VTSPQIYRPDHVRDLQQYYGELLGALKSLLKKHPKLLTEHSSYGHKACLLHYTASNGVELWRQQVPTNIVEIAKILLHQGADKNAPMKVYGREFTAYALAESSGHPYDAGIAPELLAVLK